MPEYEEDLFEDLAYEEAEGAADMLCQELEFEEDESEEEEFEEEFDEEFDEFEEDEFEEDEFEEFDESDDVGEDALLAQHVIDRRGVLVPRAQTCAGVL